MLIYFSKSPLKRVCFKCSSRACLYLLSVQGGKTLWKMDVETFFSSWSCCSHGHKRIGGISKWLTVLYGNKATVSRWFSTRGFRVTITGNLERLIWAYLWQQLTVCDRTCSLRPSLSETPYFCWKMPKAALWHSLQVCFLFLCAGFQHSARVKETILIIYSMV